MTHLKSNLDYTTTHQSNTVWLIVLLVLVSLVSYGQEERKEINITSDVTRIDEEKYPGAVLFSKSDNQIYIKHEGVEMWCDVAFFYKDENFVKAYKNVRIKQGDSVAMRSRYAEYNGCLLYTSPSPRDQRGSRMPSSA